ncbi:MAG: FMN-binding glutamate synthase family protein [Candidatus Absconditicoccaceae bacterium]
MQNFIEVMTLIGAVAFFIMLLTITLLTIWMIRLYRKNVKQPQHALLRGYPLMGKIRYIAEMVGPELRQYWFNNDMEGKPFSRFIFVTIVKMSKYASTIIPFGSKRDFSADGFFLRPTPFPLNKSELSVNMKQVGSYIYSLIGHGLFWRNEKIIQKNLYAWAFTENDYIIIGKNDSHIAKHWTVKRPFGATGMSYGALGKNAIKTLSLGAAISETWINTGEGGLTPQHLEGGGNVVYQLGPGLFGSRNSDGIFSVENFTKNMSYKNVVACEIKHAQGAKVKGGFLPKEKNTPEVAKLRGVEPGIDIESPNRNPEFHDTPSLIQFIARLKQHSCGKPVGIKIVVGQVEELDSMFELFSLTGMYPNFITVDGSEGGSGATHQEMADTLALPLFEALPIVVELLKKHNLRDKITVFASGKLVTADQVAIALCLGADCVNTGRGMMIAMGCIMAETCDSNACPAGVATTDPEKEKNLVIEEKKYRVANYVLTMCQSLFTLGAACGIKSPRHFNLKHLGYRKSGKTMRGEEYIKYIMEDQLPKEKISFHEEKMI